MLPAARRVLGQSASTASDGLEAARSALPPREFSRESNPEATRGVGPTGQSRLILCLRDKAHHADGVPWVVPAKAGTQRRRLLCDVGPSDEWRAWMPACAGMTRVSKRAASLTTSESLRTNGIGRPHSRRDCPGSDPTKPAGGQNFHPTLPFHCNGQETASAADEVASLPQNGHRQNQGGTSWPFVEDTGLISCA